MIRINNNSLTRCLLVERSSLTYHSICVENVTSNIKVSAHFVFGDVSFKIRKSSKLNQNISTK